MIQPEDNSDKNNNTILDKNELSSIDKQSYFKISYDEQVIPTCNNNFNLLIIINFFFQNSTEKSKT